MLVLQELSDASALHTLDIPDDDWYVAHMYNGFDTLQFELPVDSAYYPFVHEECKVTFIGSRDRDMRFIIKNIDEHSDFVTIDCDIDLDDWESKIFESFRVTDSTLDNVLGMILPDGWSKSGTDKYTKRTTVEDTEGKPIYACTPLEVLDHVTKAYGCVFNFDNLNKTIYVVNPDDEKPSGEYVSDELNLTSRPGFVGNSSNFATRIYAYGKRDDEGNNPLTFADINGGKEYVEDFSYSDKVICVGWNDERYTVKQDLLDAAKAKLASISKPTRSYSCKVAQLNYNVWMYRVVTLLDTVRNIRVDHQVVEWHERANPAYDEVVLSAVQPSIEKLVQHSIDNSPEKMREEIVSAYTQSIQKATKAIIGSYGGYFKWILDADGNPMELVNLADSTDINSAQHVWRWNKAGLGHSNSGYNGTYDLAMLSDGSINASMMTVGIIRGGNSFWNLNTGELSLWGEFRASYVDKSNGNYTQTLHIKPDYQTYSNSNPDITFEGPALVFESSDEYKSAVIHRAISQMHDGSRNYGISNVEIIGGVKKQHDPGGYLRVGSKLDDSGKLYGEGYLTASSDYLSQSDEYDAYFSAYAYGDHSKTSVESIAKDPNGEVGMIANISDGNLYLGGYLSGINNRATFSTVVWLSAQTAKEFTTSTFNATTASPAKYGTYIPFCTVDSYLEDSKYIIGTTSDHSASGWRGWTGTFPHSFVSAVNANWSTDSSTGVVSNLSINVESKNLFNSFVYLFYTIGILYRS
jgi:phage minor structural protein